MNYKVSEIAKFTVATAKKMGIPINCSKLHLIVTMLWINYYKKTKKNLFNENISAGSTQPVIGAIDLLYRNFGDNNISVKSALDLMTSIKIEDQDVIREYVTPLIKANTEDLKKILCGSDSAWNKTHKANPGENKPVIPFDLLAHTTLVKKNLSQFLIVLITQKTTQSLLRLILMISLVRLLARTRMNQIPLLILNQQLITQMKPYLKKKQMILLRTSLMNL